MKFRELGIDAAILRAVEEVGYTEPTPIQERAIPPVLAGRDLLGCAQTGTGKTAAFSIPILQRMGKPEGSERPVRALILTPTRELALQIYENVCQYGRYTGRIAAVIYGGVSQVPQVEALQRGADILIATPGRLWDLMGQELLDIGQVDCFVLDEADRMLDMGFINDVKKIAKSLPKKRQTLLFSATMPDEIAALAEKMLHKPVRVEITPAATPVELIEQGVYFAEKAEKRTLLKAVLRERNLPQTLIFTRTKHGADRVARDLNRAGMSAKALHGDKSQGARQTALKEFKEYKIACLVATDIAARGLDISELPLVINFDLPNVGETYVHRIGRTGRAGMEGTALSFCAEDEKPYLKDIEKLIGMHIERLEKPEYTEEDTSAPAPKRGRRKAAATERPAEQEKADAARAKHPRKPSAPVVSENAVRGKSPRGAKAAAAGETAAKSRHTRKIAATAAPKTEQPQNTKEQARRKRAVREQAQRNQAAREQAQHKKAHAEQPAKQQSANAAKKPRSGCAETAVLSERYPRRSAAASPARRRERRKEDLSMDILSPRPREIPADTAARIQAKVAAKLAEREEIKRIRAEQEAKKPAQKQVQKPVKHKNTRTGRGRGSKRPSSVK